MRPVLSTCVAALVAIAAASCGPPMSRGVSRVFTNADLPNSRLLTLDDGVTVIGWESSGWTDEWISVGPEATITVQHSLGRTPFQMGLYVSFDREGGESVVAAGDLARIITATSTDITLWNHSQNQLYLRVALE